MNGGLLDGDGHVLLTEAEEILQVTCFALGHHGLIVIDEVLKECGLAFGEVCLTVAHKKLCKAFERIHGLRSILHRLFEEDGFGFLHVGAELLLTRDEVIGLVLTQLLRLLVLLEGLPLRLRLSLIGLRLGLIVRLWSRRLIGLRLIVWLRRLLIGLGLIVLLRRLLIILRLIVRLRRLLIGLGLIVLL